MSDAATLMTGRFVIPELVATHFHVRAGDTVGDFGAGSGYFIKTLAELVGPTGTVYACEIQKNLVETMGELARRENLGNVNVLWGDCEEVHGSKIPTDSLDVAIMVNTFFQFEDQAGALIEIKRCLRPGGKLFIIDWSESFGGLGPQPDQVVTKSDAEGVAVTAGFTKDRDFDAGDHHYGLAFRI